LIVLDTHVLIWMVQDDDRLGQQMRQTIDAQVEDGTLLFPAICVWEIALQASRGRIRLPLPPAAWTRRILQVPRFSLVPLKPEIAADAVDLDWPHKDPADRMIVASAMHMHLPLATADRAILDYAAAGHLLAIDARL